MGQLHHNHSVVDHKAEPSDHSKLDVKKTNITILVLLVSSMDVYCEIYGFKKVRKTAYIAFKSFYLEEDSGLN